MLRAFLARYHHVFCSDNDDCPWQNIKLDRYLFTAEIFVFWFDDDVRGAYVKKLLMKFQRKTIVGKFCRAGPNTPSLALTSLALCYILPTGWDDIYGKQFFRNAFRSLRLYTMVLYVDST